MNPAIIILGMGWQPHCDSPGIAANASAGLNAEATEVQPVDPAKFLVGSPELWKFRRTNVSAHTKVRRLTRPDKTRDA
jgi:hypothetical protein